MLEVSHLSRCYGAFKAVDNVSFAIDKGEIVGLLGHNGAGKTTIMKMLSGYLEPDAGKVCIDGLDLAQHAKQIQRSLGYLPENLPVYGEMTVADYLDYAAELKGLSGPQKREEIRRAVRATDLGVKLTAPINTLSRGFKQRVGVAQAILGRPKLLILDEPTNGLDPTQTQQMRALIREIAREATVILSTHILQEVDALCDRVLIIHGGRLAVDEKLSQLRAGNALWLETSSSASGDKLRSVDGVASVEQLQEEGGYRLALAEGADPRAVSAALAKVVVEAGEQLYRLQPEQRDLESLFRQVSETGAMAKEELKDAA
ncbi:ABC-2 type transport system ATP-binding protein [Microbulbifer thermotolerans]|uniref:ABC transporter ATP-binding protein n=1 Tax=Microbulbifer thermotolerans TaxID=252514 RepID=UPI0008E79CE7|nr:ABC transporter ATP-binding protein [Microbulbifer thermotolerans]SFB67601.1 ABC-2 type transport system ATP-binding protein [Microbulbifer thermotolerans]